MIAKLEPRIALPETYTAGPITPEKEQETVDLINAYSQWMYGEPATTLEMMRVEWAEEGFDRETDTVVVTAPDGRIVGYNNIWDITSLHVRMFGWMAVDPDLLGMGIEDFLVNWAIERARKNVEKAAPGTRVVLHMSINATHEGIGELMETHSLRHVRNFYRMLIDLDQTIPEPQIPAGITIRPINGEGELRPAIAAVHDSFRDHWGYIEEPFEEYCKRWERNIKSDPYYDPALYFVAMDGETAAGISLCYAKIEEDPDLAWVGTLGVRRDYRKRGLALALLHYSFREFQRLGRPKAGLGVDADSMTGAVRLYERAGMHVARMTRTYEYELRPGEDLMRKQLED